MSTTIAKTLHTPSQRAYVLNFPSLYILTTSEYHELPPPASPPPPLAAPPFPPPPPRSVCISQVNSCARRAGAPGIQRHAHHAHAAATSAPHSTNRQAGWNRQTLPTRIMPSGGNQTRARELMQDGKSSCASFSVPDLLLCSWKRSNLHLPSHPSRIRSKQDP